MRIFVLIVFLLTQTLSFSQSENPQENQTDAQGRKHGLWRGYHPESKRLRYEGTFEHGREKGTFKYFDDTKAASVIATREFDASGDAYTTFYDQQKNKVSEGVIRGKKYEGEWKYYHKGGKQLMSVEFYKDGLLQGVRKVFYPDGTLAEETTYVAGKKQGPYKKYALNGIVLEEAHYQNDQLHGEAIYRNADGKIASKGPFVEGLKKGYWEFYKDGKLQSREKFPQVKKFKNKPRTEKKP